MNLRLTKDLKTILSKTFLRLSILALLAVFSVSNANADCTLSTTKVSNVYPRSDQLPENLLRFYIYFSEPMAREDVLSAISLLDAQGVPATGVFLEHKFDLWSPDGKRLTLLFDPGRVKTGLVAHNKLGRALIPGSSYTLQVDGAKNASGCKLAASHEKSFEVIEGYSSKLDKEQWQLGLPKPETMEPLQIVFDREMDHLSIAYRIRVQDKEGNSIRGALDLIENERVWEFTPSQVWQKIDYQITLDTALEDVAGNRLTGLFDQPSSEGELSVPVDQQILLFSL